MYFRLKKRVSIRRFGWPLALAVLGYSVVQAFAQTLPQGGTVVGGSGTITQTNANQLTITQSSQNLAIDWQSFSVGANNIVRFVQPSTSAVALNRVLNGDPSQIYGQIQANGQVIVMSPNGIVFGPNSRIDVNALVATTANISTVDFMAGNLLFDQASSDANARVVNQGIISVAQGGFAVLAAANVSNQGQIIANGGTVVLGGTKTFAIDFHGDGLLKFAATGAVDQKTAGADALVENSGSIEANGGRVLLTARAARSVLDNVINTTGIVVARTASFVNGEIVIDGGDTGIVRVAGTLDASGSVAGESGGTAKYVLASNETLAAGNSSPASNSVEPVPATTKTLRCTAMDTFASGGLTPPVLQDPKSEAWPAPRSWPSYKMLFTTVCCAGDGWVRARERVGLVRTTAGPMRAEGTVSTQRAH
jgi:filamentous hemagglutinin family protein